VNLKHVKLVQKVRDVALDFLYAVVTGLMIGFALAGILFPFWGH
jgi:hypothetical protein